MNLGVIVLDNVVEMLNITKDFPGIRANDDITLQLRKGEIHALLGENGAGKSTLMSVLFGLYQPDKGRILVNGKAVHISNPNIANDLGIGMVHQHFKLVHNFTVTENIVLGKEPKMSILGMDLKLASQKIKELSDKYNLNVEPDSRIQNISVGMQQRVEILKMLYRDAEILIFDEPTAVLTPQEILELIKIMKNLVKEGKSIILITHKLREIIAAADRCTVLRRGKVVGTVDVLGTSQETMAEMMVGRMIDFEIAKKPQVLGKTILEIANLNVMSNKKVLGLKDFSVTVRAGEILGVAGVDGNGQTELMEAITGMRKVESGSILLNGKDIKSSSIRKRIEAGIAHIPEDRQKRGLVLDYSLENNLVLEVYYKKPFSKRGILNQKEINNHANKVIKQFDVRAGEGAFSLARSLSGGNQQKAIVGREIDLNPDLLIAVQPTRGLDVGSIEYIHKRILEQRDSGKAVLLVSLELDEILGISDRIAVINNGELVGIVDAKDTDENEVGLMMMGIGKEEAK